MLFDLAQLMLAMALAFLLSERRLFFFALPSPALSHTPVELERRACSPARNQLRLLTLDPG